MATATVQRRAQIRDVKEYTYLWEGTDRNNRQVRGEMRAASETVVTTSNASAPRCGKTWCRCVLNCGNDKRLGSASTS